MYREQWLNEALLLLKKEVFTPNKYKPPGDIRISCGFPNRGAFGVNRVIGQCWYPSSAGTHQLFISPTLDDPIRVLDVTVHEVCHTLAGKDARHGKHFKYVATRVGLVGKMTATVAGPVLQPKLEAIAKQLGDYPHKAIQGGTVIRMPQPKSIKCECECGYTARVSEEWIEIMGPPLCPGCKVQMGL